jgi:predicted RNA binding protein YcfA (HicA-like mRNA interferase family)
MSKADKAIQRLLSKPKDFTWNELKTVLSHFGYVEKRGKGSRRKFVQSNNQHTISLHEPHPKPILKMYMINEVIDTLKKQNLI